jgi:tRNA-dihydrouridine synthase
MANVTDSVFRKLIAKYGKPDVMWTEFVSADGLISPGRKNLLYDLVYSNSERPIVAQLFTGHPEAMFKAAQLVKKLKFDGLDINMGCPDRAVEKQGGGAAHMKNPIEAIKVIEAAKNGAPGIPVTVKTRIGYNKLDWDWIKLLLAQKMPALTIHLRTRKEMSDVPAHWELMPEIIKLRNEISPKTLIIGNGDIDSVEAAQEIVKKNGCDGIMIGRGIFGKPWLFNEVSKLWGLGSHSVYPRKNVEKFDDSTRVVKMNSHTREPTERLKILIEHAKLFEKTFKGIKNFAVMKKHFKAYVNGWDGAKELRAKLMETNNSREVAKIVNEYLKQ